MKRLISCALMVLLAGCIPIGIQAKSQLASVTTSELRLAR
jgi:hypothetical protein